MTRRRIVGNTVDRSGRTWHDLRSEYFARAADIAARYAITFDDVVVHLWRMRSVDGRVALRRISHMDDLVHAVACFKCEGLAWTEFIERYEPLLIRRCSERIDGVEAILLTPRLLGALRDPTRDGSLLTYKATSSLRSWLTARALRKINTKRGATPFPPKRGRPGTRLVRPAARLTVAGPVPAAQERH